MNDLHAYVGFDVQGGPEEGALLIFAHNRREAMRIGRPWVMDWGADFLDVRVHRLQGAAVHLRTQDGPHVVESPESCERCAECAADDAAWAD